MLKPKYHQYFALFAIATFLQAISLANIVMDSSAQPEPKGAPSKTLTDVTWNPDDESLTASVTGQTRGDCPYDKVLLRKP